MAFISSTRGEGRVCSFQPYPPSCLKAANKKRKSVQNSGKLNNVLWTDEEWNQLVDGFILVTLGDPLSSFNVRFEEAQKGLDPHRRRAITSLSQVANQFIPRFKEKWAAEFQKQEPMVLLVKQPEQPVVDLTLVSDADLEAAAAVRRIQREVKFHAQMARAKEEDMSVVSSTQVTVKISHTHVQAKAQKSKTKIALVGFLNDQFDHVQKVASNYEDLELLHFPSDRAPKRYGGEVDYIIFHSKVSHSWIDNMGQALSHSHEDKKGRTFTVNGTTMATNILQELTSKILDIRSRQ